MLFGLQRVPEAHSGMRRWPPTRLFARNGTRSSSLQFGGPASPGGARSETARSGPITVGPGLFTRETGVEDDDDAEADMPSAETLGAICVQKFDDSHNSAIHTTYRISLRSSSLREPRYPLLRVVFS